MASEVAMGKLIDERRRGGSTTRGAALQEVTPGQRVRSYLVSAGTARPEDDKSLSFERRVIDDGFVLAGLHGEGESASICYLQELDTLLVDRGGRLLENEYVATLLDGYYEHYEGDFELHAQPLTATEAEDVRAALQDTGLITTQTGEEPFVDAIRRIVDALDRRF